MKLSYEGIGQWAATFAASDDGGGRTGEDQRQRNGGRLHEAGDVFCGMVLSVGRGGDACAVALGGLVTAGYTETAPEVGWERLSADGAGGVQVDVDGRTYLVVDVDTTAKTVTFAL